MYVILFKSFNTLRTSFCIHEYLENNIGGEWKNLRFSISYNIVFHDDKIFISPICSLQALCLMMDHHRRLFHLFTDLLLRVNIIYYEHSNHSHQYILELIN